MKRLFFLLFCCGMVFTVSAQKDSMDQMKRQDTSRWHQKNYNKDMRMKRDSSRMHNDSSRMDKMPLDKQPMKTDSTSFEAYFLENNLLSFNMYYIKPMA